MGPAAPASTSAPAQPPSVIPEEPGPATAVTHGIADWSAGYERAKALMITGRFADAAAAFSILAASAADSGRILLAREQASTCRAWADGGFTLVAGASEEAQERRAARQDRRTTGELATLYTTAVLYGVGSGLALAAGTKPSSAAGVILPSLAFAGASAGLVALVDRQMQLRYGVPQSIVSGMFIGLEEAIAWSGWNQARSVYSDEWSTGELAAVYWSTATAGALAGGILGTIYGTTPGRASLAGSAALWSGVVAGLAAAAFSDAGDTRDDHALLAAALALNVGGVAGVILGGEASPSIARVRFVDLGGIAGGLLFGGLYYSIEGQQSRGQAAAAWVATGATLGLATAWVLTRDMERDQPRRGHDSLLSNLVPTLAPAGNGTGLVLGVGSVI